MWLRLLAFPLVLLAGAAAAGLCLLGLVLALAYPNLPPLDVLTDYQPKIPLRVYTAEGSLIGEFGEERRSLISIREVPDQLKQAIISAEDERFYQHTGVDYVGVARAAWANLAQGGRRQGASTITMQVARNFFLSSEKTLTRKLYEALLAFKIEHNLSKDQILELYINQIYLGQRAYGFAAASQIYFGKSLDRLTLGEIAILAGLPKAPSAYNPVANPQRSQQRQQYVLRRMRELGYINDRQYADATKAPLHVRREADDFTGVHGEYLAEMVRQAVYEQYPDDTYTKGFRVYTTIRKADQEAAYEAVRRGLMAYDRSQGYRGPEAFVELAPAAGEDEFEEALAEHPDVDDLKAALVVAASTREVKAVLRSGEAITLAGEGLKFAARALEDKASAQRRIRRGAVIRVHRDDKKNWQITQLPEAEAAFVSLDPSDGAVRALVGGFDFHRSKFNHITQAWRQPGSSFKPFIYSASLEKGFTPATVIPDEPIVIEAEVTGSQRWEPKNYDGKFEGPMRMRTALAKSKNMVSIRILQGIDPKYAQDYVTRFGFDADKHPPYLTMALGAGSVTPMQMARAYAVLANGGYLLQPYFIAKIVDDRGNVLGTAKPAHAGEEGLRVIDGRNAFIMDSMLQDVTRYGTAASVAKLGRRDLAGKTGTTNDFVDAWFCGYHPQLVGVAWVGFDQPKSLGKNQTGGRVALPIWIDYMGKVLKGYAESPRSVPQGVVSVRLEADPAGEVKGGSEYFYREFVPKNEPPPAPGAPSPVAPTGRSAQEPAPSAY
ncbi:MAG TPA: penicillin-binding protein 1A [Burkholderiales bacterium]|jgi:penicillin-binding protein 1A|nr:penicillin-binding protein 1A [Burkholderiales bacterium]